MLQALQAYIKKIIKETTQKEITEQVNKKFEDFISGPDTEKLKIVLNKYIKHDLKHSKKDIWNLILTEDVKNMSLKINYWDEKNFQLDKSFEAKDLKELNNIVSSQCNISDIISVKNIILYLRFNYKGKVELESYNFMSYKDNAYDIETIDKVFKEIKDWIDKYPEHLL